MRPGKLYIGILKKYLTPECIKLIKRRRMESSPKNCMYFLSFYDKENHLRLSDHWEKGRYYCDHTLSDELFSEIGTLYETFGDKDYMILVDMEKQKILKKFLKTLPQVTLETETKLLRCLNETINGRIKKILKERKSKVDQRTVTNTNDY